MKNPQRPWPQPDARLSTLSEAGSDADGYVAGWRVTVTGNAGLIRDQGEVARYHRALPLWPVSNGTGQLIRLHPGLMGGYRFLGADGERA
jgi:hypothetical protein